MIQRYGIRHEVLKGTPDGEFVTYADHRRAVAELERELDNLRDERTYWITRARIHNYEGE